MQETNPLFHKFAVKAAGLLLARNGFYPLEGEAVQAIAGADLYCSRTKAENKGYDFAVNSHWVETREEADALAENLTPGEEFNGIIRYNVIVINKGKQMVVSPDIKDRCPIFGIDETIYVSAI